VSFTFGNSGRFGVSNAQCVSHFAPWSTHRFNKSISAAVSFFPDFGGGITSSSSELSNRLINSLSLLAPGLMM
jgi:hypothetical protein